ncbi:MAG: hypothetical protein HYT99_00330 [Candidatus Tectomicrobia bacterium]|nr:hypothetical protein [Candidatus Tectomicrobia bacterium]
MLLTAAVQAWGALPGDRNSPGAGGGAIVQEPSLPGQATRAVVDAQREIVRRMAGLMRARGGDAAPWGAALAGAAAFGLGVLHAMLPGHGKTVVISYFLARPARVLSGFGMGFRIAAVHAFSAVLLVLLGRALISRAAFPRQNFPLLQAVSYGFIALVGLCLLIEALLPRRPHDPADRGDAFHHATGRISQALPYLVGFVPCPLTTLIMLFAAAQNRIVMGVGMSAAMAAGMTVTLGGLGMAVVLARSRAMAFLETYDRLYRRLAQGLEVAGAFGIIAFGVTFLWISLG